jgi:hypothetical protein
VKRIGIGCLGLGSAGAWPSRSRRRSRRAVSGCVVRGGATRRGAPRMRGCSIAAASRSRRCASIASGGAATGWSSPTCRARWSMAAIAAEDRRFESHEGVDWMAMLGASGQIERRVTGVAAARLTMQLVAEMEPRLGEAGRRGLLDKWAPDAPGPRDRAFTGARCRCSRRGST